MFPIFSKNFAKAKAPDVASGSMGGAAESVPKKHDARFILSLSVFVLSILGMGAAYGINLYLDSQIAAIEDNLLAQEETLKPAVIRELDSFDKQVRILRDLGEVRGGYAPLLYELSSIVVSGVQYTSATVSLTSEGTYTVTVRATANSLITYLQQAEVIASLEGVLRDISLSSYTIQREDAGRNSVAFVLEVSLSPSDVISGQVL